MAKFICPLPFISLSLDAGHRVRICCHDTTAESLPLKGNWDESLNQELHKNVRREMLEGDIPKNCQGCHKIEQLGGFSPRMDYVERFTLPKNLENKFYENQYLDITMDSNCNLTCRMCHPKYSKGLESDFKSMNIPIDQEFLSDWDLKMKNTDSFLEALSPQLLHLKRVVITGGEPFKSRNVEKLIGKLASLPQAKELNIRFFSNVTSRPNWLEPLLEKVGSIEIYMSLDSSRESANYVRYPSDWGNIIESIQSLCELKKRNHNLELRVHSVIQALTLPHIITLIEDLKKFRAFFPYIPSFTLLESPSVLSPSVLPVKLKERLINDIASYIKDEGKLSNELTINANHLIALLKQIKNEDRSNDFMQFLLYNRKFDKLRGQDIFDTFPQLQEYSD